MSSFELQIAFALLPAAIFLVVIGYEKWIRRQPHELYQSQELGGRRIASPVCAGDIFQTRYALLNDFWATYASREWDDRETKLYICRGCGFVIWARPRETRDNGA